MQHALWKIAYFINNDGCVNLKKEGIYVFIDQFVDRLQLYINKPCDLESVKKRKK